MNYGIKQIVYKKNQNVLFASGRFIELDYILVSIHLGMQKATYLDCQGPFRGSFQMNILIVF